jgi:hypothetical protein
MRLKFWCRIQAIFWDEGYSANQIIRSSAEGFVVGLIRCTHRSEQALSISISDDNPPTPLLPPLA